MTQLRILQICPKTPFPPVDGGCIAANNITQGLLDAGHVVKVMALSTPKHPAHISLADAAYVGKTGFETCFVDTSVNPLEAVRHLLSNSSYNVQRFYSKPFEQMILATLARESFDIVHFESVYTAPYLSAVRAATDAPTVCRSHNMEYEIWQGSAKLEQNPLKKWYINRLANQLESYERGMANAFDGIATITEADEHTLRRIGCRLPIATIPFGMDVAGQRVDKKNQTPAVFHLGSMDWLPNQDGIRWLLDDVWPTVVAEFPSIKLYLAGRSMPQWLKEVHRANVEVVGEVDDAFGFIASKSIMVVPLHSGGGMRIKIVEGLALGKAIVSTSLGAAGIDYTDEMNLMVADSAEAFAQRIIGLLRDPQRCDELATNARKLALETYDNARITDKLVQFYQSLDHRLD